MLRSHSASLSPGNSQLTGQAHNYFGIKAMGRAGNDGAVWMRTAEYGSFSNSPGVGGHGAC